MKRIILIVFSVILGAVTLHASTAKAEFCFNAPNRPIIGQADVFWGNPPAPYPDLNLDAGMIARMSLEGTFPGNTGGPDCEGRTITAQIFQDGNPSNIVTTVNGNLLSGFQITGGNLGSWQWFVDWPHNLSDGRYRFKVIAIDGFAVSFAATSSNVLIITGAGPPPPPLVCSIVASPASGQISLSNVDMQLSVTSGWGSASAWRVDCTNDGIFDEPFFQVTTVPTHTWVDVCNYPSPGTYTFRGRVEEQGSTGGRIAECTGSISIAYPLPAADITCNNLDACSIAYSTPGVLRWSSTNTTSCSVSPGGWTGVSNAVGQSTGNLTTTATYTLTCIGPGGSVSDSVVVTVGAPPLPVADIKCNSLDACSIPYNTAANLSWTSSNSTSCSVTPTGWTGLSNPSQSSGNLTASITYTLTCIGVGGTATNSVVVTVGAPPLPVADIKCNSLDACSIPYNTAATLSWTSSNSTACSVSPGGWTGVSSPAQSTGNLTTTATYTLTCTGVGGTATNTVVVTVAPPPLPVADIKCNAADACSIAYNTAANLSWTSSNSTACSVSPGGWTGVSSLAQSTGNLIATTTYTLSCTGVGGSRSDSVVVTVAPPPAVSADIKCNNLDACSIAYNSSATIGWTSSNSTSCSVTPTGWTGLSNPSQSSGNLTASITYTLTCTGPGGSISDSVAVTVNPPLPPFADIKCNNTDSCSIEYDTPAVLSWTSTNSTACSVSPGGWTGTANTLQSTGNLTATTTYDLTCTGLGGSVSDQVVVTVNAVAVQAAPFTLIIDNPFSGSIDSLQDLFDAAITFLYYIAGPIVVIMIILAGLFFLFARDQADKINTAKRILTYALIGFSIILIGRGFIALIESILALGS